MKRRNQIVLAVVGVLGLAAIAYAVAVMTSDPLKGKDAEADAIRAALAKVGLDKSGWRHKRGGSAWPDHGVVQAADGQFSVAEI